jgi:hypothetical protein
MRIENQPVSSSQGNEEKEITEKNLVKFIKTAKTVGGLVRGRLQRIGLGRVELKNVPQITDEDLAEKMPQEFQLLNDNEALRDLYIRAFVEKDPSALREKTEKQIDLIEKYKSLGSIDDFEVFIDSLIPMTHTSVQVDELLAPIHTKIQKHGGTEIDKLVRAENYVYASFDGIAHHMTYRGSERAKLLSPEELKEANIKILDQDDFQQRAEIVMMDVVDLKGFRKGNTLVDSYINNCFDYETGKQLLAVYLSKIFKTPEEAMRFILHSNDRRSAQNWSDIRFTRFGMPESLHPRTKEEYDIIVAETNQRHIEIIDRMKEIYEEIGIVPPLALEIRIHDSAKVLNSD